jgi:hypothetical protein
VYVNPLSLSSCAPCPGCLLLPGDAALAAPSRTKPFRRAMSLLAEALRAKVAHVEAWRRHPSAVNAPGGVFVTTKLLRPLFADLCALATECLPLVPLLCGTQFVRTVDTLRGVSVLRVHLCTLAHQALQIASRDLAPQFFLGKPLRPPTTTTIAHHHHHHHPPPPSPTTIPHHQHPHPQSPHRGTVYGCCRCVCLCARDVGGWWEWWCGGVVVWE